MPAQTLEEIVSAAQNLVSQSIKGSAEKQKNLEAMAGKATEIADVYKTIASDVAVVTATQQSAELKVQAAKAQQARAAGLDPEAGANVIVDLLTKQKAANQETEAALKEVRAKRETNLFSNPIDWVVAQVTLPFSEAKLEGAASSAQLYQKQVDGVNASLQNSFQTAEKLKESVTATSAVSAARAAAGAALVNSNQAQLEALKYNNIAIDEATNATKDQLNAAYTVFGAQKAQEQLALAQASEARQAKQFDLTMALRQDELDAKQQNRDIDTHLLGKINVGRASMGLAPIEGIEAKSAVQLLKSGASKDLNTFYEIGDKTISNGGKVQIADTPARAIDMLSKVPSALPDIRKETAQILSEAVKALGENKAIDRKNQDQVDAFLNAHVKETTATLYKSITPNSQNLFDVGDLGSYMTLSGIKELPVVTKLLAPLAEAKQPLNDPKMVLGFMQDAIKKGALTTSEVAGLATVYQKANLINQAARGFKSLGIPIPNNGANYNAKVGMFGEIVDMTDAASVQRYLVKEMSKNAGNRIQEQRAANPFSLN